MWELLNELLKAAMPAVAGQGLKMALGGVGGGPLRQATPSGQTGGGMPGGGPVGGGTPNRPSSMNFQGGFTGGAPMPTTSGGSPEGSAGGTGFTSLGRSLMSARSGGQQNSGGNYV